MTTKRTQRTSPDDPVSRDVVLALAERARRSENTALRDLLLMVAGMLAADGRVLSTDWQHLCRLSGTHGIGLMLSKKHEYQKVQEQVRGGMAALDEQVKDQAHGWSYTPIADLTVDYDSIEMFDSLVITTVGELVAFIKDRGPAWAEENIVRDTTVALAHFRAKLPPEQQAAFDRARRPGEEKPKREKKAKEKAS